MVNEKILQLFLFADGRGSGSPYRGVTLGWFAGELNVRLWLKADIKRRRA